MPQNNDKDALIHDWNGDGDAWRPPFRVMLDDETLRDGLQGPSVVDPPIETKRAILRAMDRLGIDTADVGMSVVLIGRGRSQRLKLSHDKKSAR
jgi:hypothetical protein